MTGTLSLPEIGSKNTLADERVLKLLEQYRNLLDSSNLIPGTSLATAAAIADTQLASPNNSVYRVLYSGGLARFAAAAIAGTYIPVSGATSMAISGVEVSSGIHIFNFAKADWEVAGKTQKLRVRASIAANATKPTIKFTFGLYPITVAGGVNLMTFTAGTVVSGSTVEINEPAASTITSAVGSDFTIPADGAYAWGVVTSGTLTNNSAVDAAAQLQSRNV